MSNSISITQVPMILIFSDVFEGKYRPEDLERILDRNILYSPAVSILIFKLIHLLVGCEFQPRNQGCEIRLYSTLVLQRDG
jgi:hypothetical protein